MSITFLKLFTKCSFAKSLVTGKQCGIYGPTCRKFGRYIPKNLKIWTVWYSWELESWHQINVTQSSHKLPNVNRQNWTLLMLTPRWEHIAYNMVIWRHHIFLPNYLELYSQRNLHILIWVSWSTCGAHTKLACHSRLWPKISSWTANSSQSSM